MTTCAWMKSLERNGGVENRCWAFGDKKKTAPAFWRISKENSCMDKVIKRDERIDPWLAGQWVWQRALEMAALNQNSALLFLFLDAERESIKNEAACGCSERAVIVGTFTSSHELRQNACVAIKSSPHLSVPRRARVKIINKYWTRERRQSTHTD